MSFRDILFPVLSYPDATPDRAIANAAALGRRFGGAVTAVALEVDIKAPHNKLANALIGVDAMVRSEEARSRTVAQAAVQTFISAAARAGLVANAIFETAPLYLEGEQVAAHARTRDLTLMSVGPQVQADIGVAEQVLFESGRPICVFAEDRDIAPGARFEKVAIAWDGSRAAARAVADALPVLKTAGAVRILLVSDEKPGVKLGLSLDLERHLIAHGVETWVNDVPAGGRPIGAVVQDYVRGRGIDLLVMGGFGHSRAREFVLGGATASLINAPPCPVLMSH